MEREEAWSARVIYRACLCSPSKQCTAAVLYLCILYLPMYNMRASRAAALQPFSGLRPFYERNFIHETLVIAFERSEITTIIVIAATMRIDDFLFYYRTDTTLFFGLTSHDHFFFSLFFVPALTMTLQRRVLEAVWVIWDDISFDSSRWPIISK